MASDTALTTSIAEQAAHWWVVFHTDDPSPAEHEEFAQWVARSPERVEAYLRMAQLEHTLKKGGIDWPASPTKVLVSEARAMSRDEFEVRREQTAFAPKPSRSRVTALQLASGFVAACLIAVGSMWFISTRPLELQTKLGEQRSIQLVDGSHVTLNTASKLQIEIRKNRRLARLLQGEALFEVAHDASRPFEVATDRATLKDVGTQFDVDERAERTTITVIEGGVEITSRVGSTSVRSTLPTLSASDQLEIGSTGLATLKRDVNVGAAIAWKEHRLVFERRPLQEVAAELNRYNPDKVQIESADLADQAITGVFETNAVRPFLSFLAGIPGVQVRDNPDGNHVVTVDGRAPSRK